MPQAQAQGLGSSTGGWCCVRVGGTWIIPSNGQKASKRTIALGQAKAHARCGCVAWAEGAEGGQRGSSPAAAKGKRQGKAA